MKIYKIMNICSSHQLDLPYDSPCNRNHGHNYKIEIWLESDKLKNDMLIDFMDIKKIVNQLDHRNLNDIMDVRTTAENISIWIREQIKEQFTGKVKVRVWETDTCYAESGVE
jgi:6-pyruvoyltetrahydropterin/6-carboxytetrahydropterin synthase